MVIHNPGLGPGPDHSPDPDPVSGEEWAIETRGLAKVYGRVTALRSLSMRVPSHAICGFLGPNGSGKSTTIKLLLGLARPSSGSGTIFGHDIATDSIAIRRRVGYLAQDPQFYSSMTARETLQFTAHFFYSGPPEAINRRVNETLELVGLQDKADRPTGGFSGGERQRLGIAQAYINNPDLLILDEPAASLDPIGRRDVLDIMLGLRGHTTIFYSTHLLDDVQRVSDMVVIMKDGVAAMQSEVGPLLGGEKIVYKIRGKGNWRPAFERLHMQPWVQSIKTVDHDNQGDTFSGYDGLDGLDGPDGPDDGQDKGIVLYEPFALEVTVTGAAAAEAHLVALLTEGTDVTIAEFGRKKIGLEDVFLGIMRGGHPEEFAEQQGDEDHANSRGSKTYEPK
jgi:ABC-2 type transport system ATP-binding protein